ncbi:unnamed protein product [Anisakis simplex]|uniref:CUT domain-containing protein n=1 Tax=Anisakis simplex TaxID=6269 RepID=A0A0M3K6E0_ANISI|nr:unnamed protein product [Anisakis simplex]
MKSSLLPYIRAQIPNQDEVLLNARNGSISSSVIQTSPITLLQFGSSESEDHSSTTPHLLEKSFDSSQYHNRNALQKADYDRISEKSSINQSVTQWNALETLNDHPKQPLDSHFVGFDDIQSTSASNFSEKKSSNVNRSYLERVNALAKNDEFKSDDRKLIVDGNNNPITSKTFPSGISNGLKIRPIYNNRMLADRNVAIANGINEPVILTHLGSVSSSTDQLEHAKFLAANAAMSKSNTNSTPSDIVTMLSKIVDPPQLGGQFHRLAQYFGLDRINGEQGSQLFNKLMNWKDRAIKDKNRLTEGSSLSEQAKNLDGLQPIQPVNAIRPVSYGFCCYHV